MNRLKELQQINWLQIALFYGILLAGTYAARKLPNLLQIGLAQVTDIPFFFNYNHGIVSLIVALGFYKFSNVKQKVTLLGTNKAKSIVFPVVLFVCYAAFGLNNDHGVNKHLWALLFCAFAFVYNIMEEYVWRGFLIDSLSRLDYVLKSIISGIMWAFWHLLIFKNFDQYGGFLIFLAFCIVFSFILTFAVQRTRSIIVAAAIHAFIIQTNTAAIVCFLIYMLLLLTWNRFNSQKHAVEARTD